VLVPCWFVPVFMCFAFLSMMQWCK
jgi:hypothetical protein